MRDLFDDFLEELRRREAEARGETPPPKRDPQRDEDEPDGDEPSAGDEPSDGDERSDEAEPDDATEEPSGREEPVPISRSRASGRRGGPPRGGPGGPDDGAGAGRTGRRIGLWIAIVLGIALFLLFSVGIDLWTDALWFSSVNFDGVFWTRIAAQAGLFIVGLVIALVAFLGNLWLAGRLSPPPGDGPSTLRTFVGRINDAAQASSAGRGGRARPYGDERTFVFEAEDLPDLTPLAGVALTVLAGLLALVVAASLASAWETVLLWANRVPFAPGPVAVTDPIFGRDISYFLFELPFLRLVQGLFNVVVVIALVLAGLRYLVAASRGGLTFSTPVRVHLAVLGALFLLSVAFGYQLDKYELVYSTRGVATGVSFTDQNAQFFAFDLLTVISGLSAAFLVGAAFTRMMWPLGLTIAVWLVASLLVGRLYPEAIQRFTVEPNQFAQEERYIANNIAMTRLAFDLGGWEERPFNGDAPVTQAAVDNDEDTFRNARLWDYRPLQDTLDQLQTVRKYYEFTDVDTDRYQIGDTQRQVMLSGRELALEQNTGATGWVNQRIVYTHGVGVAMVPVNEVTNEGQPRLFIGNLPPQSVAGAPTITQPRIYFGERNPDYVVVGAKQAEFDYPTGDSEQVGTATSWTGTTGIKLDTTLHRLLFALRFRDLDLLISDQITGSSQLLFHRSLSDRLGRIAPFLRFDKDPYLVIDEAGRLVYVQDAYTTSDRFPNAQAFAPGSLEGATGLGGGDLNYIRNSVKITMDAYDGTMHFYIADPDDPIVRAYAGIFPTLFSPMSALPSDLLPHLRVPEELFNVQTRMFGRYHVTNAQQFFRNDDLWTVPTGTTSEQTLPSEAYYVVMRMPGEAESEFLLLQPMVPNLRPNMISWIAARNDAPNYGATRVYRFPADSTVFGPAQIEARIDQDPIISQQVSLWNQSGSKVIRGNLIVVPLGESIIYLQPVYLQSTGVSFPEFQRIVVASPRNVVWAPTLGTAIDLLLQAEANNGGPTPTPTPTPGPSPGPGASPTPAPTPSSGPTEPLPSDVAGLIAYANDHFDRAQAALRAGDFATYGDEIARVKAALDRLDELAPELGLSPGASPSPAP
jgi:uncharacterized membrane protein (UPF0182 family)